jgi:hypothetical protein
MRNFVPSKRLLEPQRPIASSIYFQFFPSRASVTQNWMSAVKRDMGYALLNSNLEECNLICLNKTDYT